LPALFEGLIDTIAVLLGDMIVGPMKQIFATFKSAIDAGNSSNRILLFVF
jgi:hypothetical protein